ncbi:peptide-methionine (R)-S-oxide reductase MsrB [Pricia sp. S334]|uniref:peptide-methionine (R)-S-oxide reductase n=1 Tax=Pricia mediterranea TaxID=3076079 RepID=A0ABU3L8X5_9FLAO|nr:peptide-methionine (R)-S-oxide reductase MsrB [Pricia sp. S334]MDT7830013.1 peptide-methionine (R)-S-oxide reductase MsrB [Pricia sp. S334]
MYIKLALALCLLLTGCNGNSQKQNTAMTQDDPSEKKFEVVKTDAEWQKELTPMEYQVLRNAATENPFTSELLDNQEEGTYVCAACGTELFESDTKFKSGTGWPSFYKEIEGNVAYDVDYKIGVKRTEEHCATCGGHLGHVFEDGPEPTGLRHCVNGAALDFVPSSK